jgi:hypothetical protein
MKEITCYKTGLLYHIPVVGTTVYIWDGPHDCQSRTFREHKYSVDKGLRVWLGGYDMSLKGHAYCRANKIYFNPACLSRCKPDTDENLDRFLTKRWVNGKGVTLEVHGDKQPLVTPLGVAALLTRIQELEASIK